MSRLSKRVRRSPSIAIEHLEGRSLLSASGPGALDPAFGSGGKVVTPLGPATDIFATAVAADGNGKILVAAQDGDSIAVIRYRPNGALDTSFGSGGKEIFNFGPGHSTGSAVMAVQADGKILIGGSDGASNDKESFVLRLTTSGALDKSFGSGGTLRLHFGAFPSVNAIAALPSGKILIAAVGVESANHSTFIVERLNSNGTLDSTFGVSGLATLPVATQGFGNLTAMAVQSDGKILLGGYWDTMNSDGTMTSGGVELARLTSAGKPDNTFGHLGLAGGPGIAYGMTLQSNGKILIVGEADFSNSGFFIERFNPTGTLDTTFDGGHTLTKFAGSKITTATAVVVQPSGNIVVAGDVDLTVGVARYNSAGVLDQSFGTGGKLTTTFGSGLLSVAAAVTLQSSGRIVIAGEAFTNSPSVSNVGVLRYLGDHAVLADGQSAVTTGTTSVADPRLLGTVIASRTVNVTTGTGPTTTHGQVQEWVEKEAGTGTLDFYYRIVNTSSPAAGIFNLIATNFNNYTTYVDYRPDSAGTIAPVTADRTSFGTVTFNFLPTPDGNGTVNPGTQSYALFIKTNATHYDLHGTMILNNVINYDGYEPVG